MKAGRTLTDLAAEIERQQRAKLDFVAPCRALEIVPRIVGNVGDPHSVVKDPLMRVGTKGDFSLRPTAHQQVATHLGIPWRYWERMTREAPFLLAANANHWFQQDDSKRMVRTLDNRARAFLSDRYRPLDHANLAQAVLPAFAEVGVDVVSCQVTEDRLYLKAVSPRLQGEVKRGDVVQGGVVVSNSETGRGSLRVESLLYRLICLNGMIASTAIRRTHLGRSTSDGIGDDAREHWTGETHAASDHLLFLQVRDVTRGLLTEASFQRHLGKLRGAAEDRITGNPNDAIETLGMQLNLTQDERGSVLRHLIEGGDLSRYGVSQAVTRAAQDVESYDRATELEAAGWQVIELPRNAWQTVAGAR